MRRTVTFLTLLIYFNSCTTTKISWDRIKEGDVRHIGTKGMETKIDNASYSFSLTLFSGLYSNDYCLLISSLWRIETSSAVLLKLGNDEVIKLISDKANVGKVDWPSYKPIIGGTSTSGVLTTEKVDYYSSIYSLSPDVLKKIEQYGVIKIRIQYGDTYKEKNWNSDKLGKYIKKCHVLIVQQLKKSHVTPKSIEDNF